MRKWKPPTQDYQKRANESIAQGALTNSKRPECLIKGVYPTHLVSGRGCMVTDVEGKEYVDFICGLGSNLLGYAHSEVNAAVSDRLARGATLSLGTPVELELAEKLKELFPFIGKTKFLKTGSDACSAAIRIARAYTGREYVWTEGYHGWHDSFVSVTSPALGVIREQKVFSTFFDDLSHIAAIIVEPISTDTSEERIGFLRHLRDICTKSGTLLIFDEVITGFRFPKYSVSNYYGIEPDIICLGKGMGNGLPIAAVCGPDQIMNCGEYFVSSTFAGETLSLASALKTIDLLQSKHSIQDLWDAGERFQRKFNENWPEMLRIEGYPTRGIFVGDAKIKALFWQEACKAGILFGPSFWFIFPHMDQADFVLSTVENIFRKLKAGGVRLEGQAPTTPFAQKTRGQS